MRTILSGQYNFLMHLAFWLSWFWDAKVALSSADELDSHT